MFDSLKEATTYPGTTRGQLLRLNDKGFGKEGNYGNFGFTTELRTTFFFFGNEQFEFSGVCVCVCYSSFGSLIPSAN